MASRLNRASIHRAYGTKREYGYSTRWTVNTESPYFSANRAAQGGTCAKSRLGVEAGLPFPKEGDREMALFPSTDRPAQLALGF